jgi:hypothetical protein
MSTVILAEKPSQALAYQIFKWKNERKGFMYFNMSSFGFA